MKQVGMVNLEVEKGDKNFTFSMPFGAPYGEAYDVLFEMLQEIVKLSQAAADKLKREEEEKVVKEKEE